MVIFHSFLYVYQRVPPIPKKPKKPPTRSTSKFLHRQRRTRRALLPLRWHHGGEVGLAVRGWNHFFGQLQCWVMWLRFWYFTNLKYYRHIYIYKAIIIHKLRLSWDVTPNHHLSGSVAARSCMQKAHEIFPCKSQCNHNLIIWLVVLTLKKASHWGSSSQIWSKI